MLVLTRFSRRGGVTLAVVSCVMAVAACNGSSSPAASATSRSAAASTSAVAAPAVPSVAPTSPVTTPAATSPAAASAPASPPATSAAPTSASPTSASPTSAAATSGAPAASGGGGKCTDLTNAAATAAVGKPTTVKADASPSPLAGDSICNVTVANEVYPIQLSVDTKNAAAAFAAERAIDSTNVDIKGVGDKAYTSTIGVVALSGGALISVIGPAGPVLSKNFTIPTAIAKAMAAALK